MGTKHSQEVFFDDQGQEHISPHDYNDFFHIINYNNVIIPQNSKYGYD